MRLDNLRCLGHSMKQKAAQCILRGQWCHLAFLTFSIIFIFIFLKLFIAISIGEPSLPEAYLELDRKLLSYHPSVLDIELKAKQTETAFYWKHNGQSRMSWPFQCRRLLEGEQNYVKEAIQYTKDHPRKPVSNYLFIDLLGNCTDFKNRRGYLTKPLSDIEAEFPIAFSILFYKDIHQVERLLRAIYHPQNTYCLHVDGYSSDMLLLAAKALARCFDNVFVASKLEKIVYASYSRLKAEINCMDDALQHNKTWKYYINLASQDFPLKTNYEMVKILSLYNGSNDIEGIDGARVLHSRFKYRFLLSQKRPRSKPSLTKTDQLKNKPPHGITIVRGSAYGIFSRDFVKFIIQDKRSRDLLEWSKDTFSPDEHFWATLHHLKHNPRLETPGGYKGEPNRKPWNAVYAAWGRGDIDPCFSGKFVHGVCIFGLADLPQLISRKEFFANKFHFNFQYLALDCLEEWLYNRTVTPPIFDSYYFRRLPFINGPMLEPPTKKPKVKAKSAQKVQAKPKKIKAS